MASSFRIVDHVVPSQHIREYPRGLADEQEVILHQAVKQYIPLDNLSPKDGDVTIISSHANGFPKEMYEPLFEDLLSSSRSLNFRIRSIWIADVANQGASGVLNKDLLGDDPNLGDYARDILYMINLKRDEMPRPIIGIGHSMGGTILVDVALMHPRLFTSLILLDPAMMEKLIEFRGKPDFRPVQYSIFRRSAWPSREAAVAEFTRFPFYKKWDPRAMDAWCKHAIREAPTRSNEPSSSTSSAVVLTTPPSQETFTYLRPNFDGYGIDGKPVNHQTHPDLDPNWPHIFPFYRPEVYAAIETLPKLRPPVLYLFPDQSDISSQEQNEKKLAVTGIAVGGSGGVQAGRVKAVSLKGMGHLFPFEAVKQTAGILAERLDQDLATWRKEEQEFRRMWDQKSKAEKQTVDERWKKMAGGPPGNPLKKKKSSKI